MARKKRFRFIVVLIAIYLGAGCGIGLFELINGGPWYTYENKRGDRAMLGQEEAVMAVSGSNGEEAAVLQGYAFPGEEAAVMRVRDERGEPVYIYTPPLPYWIRLVDVVFHPLLYPLRKAGSLTR